MDLSSASDFYLPCLHSSKKTYPILPTSLAVAKVLNPTTTVPLFSFPYLIASQEAVRSRYGLSGLMEENRHT
jgi:hypothetical protein